MLSGNRKILREFPWVLLILLLSLSAIGILALYSEAQGSWHPWAKKQLVFLGLAVFVVFPATMVMPKRYIMLLSYPALLASLGLLGLVLLRGEIGGLGAKRWLNIAGFQFQPSELAKIGIIMGIAYYFHIMHVANIKRWRMLIPPAIIIGAIIVLVLMQPNLGTAAILLMITASMLFIIGVGINKFIAAFVLLVGAAFLLWKMFVKQYHLDRFKIFLNPELDPFGKGYNIIQSKIAIGSGGFWGKGYLQGSQSQLGLVPENQTDFIFTVIAEDFGFIGGTILLLLCFIVLFQLYKMIVRSHTRYTKYVITGVACFYFFHVLINFAMVMGLLPVVGVPLSLISYGGTHTVAIWAAMSLAIKLYMVDRLRL